jgi:hypothetical protein
MTRPPNHASRSHRQTAVERLLAVIKALGNLGLLVTTCFALISCNQSSDTEAAKKLVGTWTMSSQLTNGVCLKSTTAVAQSGSYVSRQTIAYDNGPSTNYTIEGVYQVQDGFVIDTVKKHSNANFTVPCIFRGRILTLTGKEWAIQNETPGTKNEKVVMRKDSP